MLFKGIVMLSIFSQSFNNLRIFSLWFRHLHLDVRCLELWSFDVGNILRRKRTILRYFYLWASEQIKRRYVTMHFQNFASWQNIWGSENFQKGTNGTPPEISIKCWVKLKTLSDKICKPCLFCFKFSLLTVYVL